jgi:hypothetical protein
VVPSESKSDGIIALADAIPGMRALTSLDISDNMLCGLYSDGSGTYDGSGVEALSEMLKINSVLKELNMSKIYIGPEGAKVLSLGLSGNGAMSTVIVHKFPLPIQDIKSKAELNFCRKELNHLDAILIAALLPLNVSEPCFRLSLLSLIYLSVEQGGVDQARHQQ